jgi:hypothetical protein
MTPWLMNKPVIAAVQGHVLGGGCELVMLCDLTIAADNATFGEPEVRFSSVGPAIVMPMIIGYKKARELLYFGDQIDAQTALSLGMINRVVPLTELPEASLRYAKRLSLISPEALYATKRAVNRGAEDRDELFEHAARWRGSVIRELRDRAQRIEQEVGLKLCLEVVESRSAQRCLEPFRQALSVQQRTPHQERLGDRNDRDVADDVEVGIKDERHNERIARR